jgi:pheromone shutdown protein TraB
MSSKDVLVLSLPCGGVAIILGTVDFLPGCASWVGDVISRVRPAKVVIDLSHWRLQQLMARPAWTSRDINNKLRVVYDTLLGERSLSALYDELTPGTDPDAGGTDYILQGLLFRLEPDAHFRAAITAALEVDASVYLGSLDMATWTPQGTWTPPQQTVSWP